MQVWQRYGYRLLTSALFVTVIVGCAASLNPEREKYLDSLELQYSAKQHERSILARQITATSDQTKVASMRARVARLDNEIVAIAKELDIPTSQPYVEEPLETTRIPVVAPEHRHAFVAEAKKRLTHDFKDPASAQYRDQFISEVAGTVLCGEVNAKNSYGAYVGFRRFYATASQLVPTEIEPTKGSFEFSNAWDVYCAARTIEVE